MVLIARLDDGRTLYAVEREDRGLYVLFQLGSWVNLQQLRAAAVVSKTKLPSATGTDSAKDNVALPLITPEASKYSKKKRLAIEAIQSMVKRPPTELSTESPASIQPGPLTPSQNEDQTSPAMNDVSAQLTAAEIFDNVRNQYFEALYSKAWLIMTPFFFVYLTNKFRPHWHILQRDLYQELARPSILTTTQLWI